MKAVVAFIHQYGSFVRHNSSFSTTASCERVYLCVGLPNKQVQRVMQSLRFAQLHHQSTMENGFVAAEEVKVSVTEVEEQVHTVSWLILWGGYLFALIACGIQNWRDRRRHDLDEEQGAPNNREGNESSSGDSTRTSVSIVDCYSFFFPW